MIQAIDPGERLILGKLEATTKVRDGVESGRTKHFVTNAKHSMSARKAAYLEAAPSFRTAINQSART